MATIIANKTEDSTESSEDTPLLQSTTSTKGLPNTRLITVEPLVVFFLAACSLNLPVVNQFIQSRLAHDRNYTLSRGSDVNGTCASMNTSDPDYIIQQEIAADLATWSTLLTLVLMVPGIFLSPFYGVVSDQVGRKITFALPILSEIVYAIVLLLMLYFQLPLMLLVFTSFLKGLSGDVHLFLGGCKAYISDVSTKKSRLIRHAVFGTVMLFASGSVQLPAGYVIDAYGFIPIVWAALVLLIAAILYLTIPRVFLETVNRNEAKTIGISELTKNIYNLFAVNVQKRRNRLMMALGIYLLDDMVQIASITITNIYGLGPPFCWSPVTLGYFNLTALFCGGIGRLFGTKLFSIFLEEHYILQIGFLFGGLSNLFLAWAPTTPLFILGVILGCLDKVTGPTLNSIISKLVTPEEYGAIFAVQGSIASVAGFISPLILNSVYSATVDTHPSFVFNVIAAIFFIAILLTWLWLFYTKRAIRQGSTSGDVNNNKVENSIAI